MAVARIVNVNEILKAKGLKPKVFNLNVFCSVVSDFFMTHETKETILLVPKRFLDMESPPEEDFIEMLDVSVWEKKAEDPDDPFDFIDYQMMIRNKILRPMIIVNEPFLTEAALSLRNICGYSVTGRTRKKKKEYIVSLPV